jgi:hypothetical protein
MFISSILGRPTANESAGLGLVEHMVLEFKRVNRLKRTQRILFGPILILRIIKKYPIEGIHSHCLSMSLLGAKKFCRKRKV